MLLTLSSESTDLAQCWNAFVPLSNYRSLTLDLATQLGHAGNLARHFLGNFLENTSSITKKQGRCARKKRKAGKPAPTDFVRDLKETCDHAAGAAGMIPPASTYLEAPHGSSSAHTPTSSELESVM